MNNKKDHGIEVIPMAIESKRDGYRNGYCSIVANVRSNGKSARSS